MSNGKYDVIVVGGGIAGIATALELVEKGRKVLLIDRDEEKNFGGLAKESFGGMFFVDSPQQRKAKIRDNADLAYQDWCRFAEFGADDHIPRQWARTYIERSVPDILEKVTARGVSFMPVVNWVERGQYQPGNSVPRFHMVWGTGHRLAVTYRDALNACRATGLITLLFRAKVTDLVREGGAVTGVAGVLEETGEAFEYCAPITVLATGGINGNDAKIRENWSADWGGEPPETLLNGSHKYADGVLHDRVRALGGQVTHMDLAWDYAAGVHHPRPRKPRHGLSLVPTKSSLWMDARGRRFGPEPLVSGYDTFELVRRVCQQDHKYSWAILNLKIALKELAISGAEFNPAIRDRKLFSFLRTILFGNKPLVTDMLDHCVDFVTASSVPELAEKMNALGGGIPIDAEGMEADIRTYDAQFDRPASLRNDEQIRRLTHLRQYRGDRVRMCKAQKILDPKALPLIAIRQFVISRKSLGGMQTDLEGQVLNQAGAPLEGLYAVGEAAGFGGGGVHGKRALEGTFLGGCMLTSLYAAKSILKKVG
ncbi:FAD-binding dehydrogenase [Sneathiella chinensis]|uniref:Fumarate reductase/succinate dehydrogenase n=1 Tax=Sneathiella chinensis TaxID=349750 RepID=A0ABQ5U0B8_9PROT|nr:FAD-binding dehydrogenase [Sneathiella chinensis]GLQ05580.1 putative fumarate reductase/succinate dehydrogenase [Sneathiella chinensis]